MCSYTDKAITKERHQTSPASLTLSQMITRKGLYVWFKHYACFKYRLCTFPMNKTLISVIVAQQWTSTIAQRRRETEVLQELAQTSAVSLVLLKQVLSATRRLYIAYKWFKKKSHALSKPLAAIASIQTEQMKPQTGNAGMHPWQKKHGLALTPHLDSLHVMNANFRIPRVFSFLFYVEYDSFVFNKQTKIALSELTCFQWRSSFRLVHALLLGQKWWRMSRLVILQTYPEEIVQEN